MQSSGVEALRATAAAAFARATPEEPLALVLLQLCENPLTRAALDAEDHAEVLRSVVERWERALRERGEDRLTRVSASRFAIIMHATPIMNALAVARRLQSVAESAAGDADGPRRYHLVFAGAATSTDVGIDSAEALLDRAQIMLHRALTTTLGDGAGDRIRPSTTLP